MKQFTNKYSDSGKYSQQGEQGIIDEIIKRLKIQSPGTCAEFGAANGQYCSNTVHLIEQGWHGTLIESNPVSFKSLIDNTINLNVKLHHGFVTVANINELLQQELDVLSIDTDGIDYSLWQAYTGDAKIVVVEINSGIKPVENEPVNDEVNGTAYKPMVELGIQKEYFLVCHTGNLVFVQNKYRKLFPEIAGDGLINADEYFNTSWL